MATRNNEFLLKNLQPYMFVLKEGSQIKKDFLDYSLLMLLVTSTEVIHSPGSSLVKTYPVFKLRH